MPSQSLASWQGRNLRVRGIAPQFLVFCTVGILNTLLDTSIYFLLTRFVLGIEFFLVAKAASYLVATLFSFFVNRFWTFGKREVIRFIEVVRFYGSVGLGIFVNVGVLSVSVQFMHLYDLVGVLLAAVATALWGFALSKWYVFKR